MHQIWDAWLLSTLPTHPLPESQIQGWRPRVALICRLEQGPAWSERQGLGRENATALASERALANPPWPPFTDMVASGKSGQAQPWKSLSLAGKWQSPTGSVPALLALPSCLCSSRVLRRPKEMASFKLLLSTTITGLATACAFKAQPLTPPSTPPSSLPPNHHHGARRTLKINWLSAGES